MIIRRKRLKRAKYNEAYFYLLANDTEGGRRIVSHEFPYIDIPATEDMGRKQKQWDILGFIAGPLYQQDADKLQKALDKDGVGTLDHPYLGQGKKVRCVNYHITEINREFGFINFRMVFCEAGEVPSFTETVPGNQETLNQSLFGKVQKVAENISGYLYQASDRIDAFTQTMENQIAPFVAVRDSLGNVTQSLTQLREASGAITAEPLALFYAVVNVFDLLKESGLGVLSLFSIVEPSLAPFFDSISTPETTQKPPILDVPGGEKGDVSPIFSECLVSTALISISEQVTETATLKREEREKSQETFFAMCDRFLKLSQNPALLNVIQELKSETFTIIQRNAKQKKTRTVRTHADTNLILLAYELTGDATKEEKLTALNTFDNPAFIPQNKELEIA